MDIRRILFEILALVSFFALCYLYFHQDEIVGISLNNYIDKNGVITTITLDQYFKTHNLEPDES